MFHFHEFLHHTLLARWSTKSNTSADSSSGLGLYIAKNFMQMQGGDIVVTSKVGKGTTFIYTLKLATAKDNASKKSG
ncbi:MAG: ATP-binding protein [Candidatus Peribacteraceae bacterium]|nr:ATP-binding protein [Candidatus Peribacteraceae bacterium]